MKRCIIHVTDVHSNGDEREENSFSARGMFSNDGNGCSLHYFEKNDDGSDIKCSVTVCGGKKVIVERNGNVMVMEKNVRHSCLYKTPYGVFDMDITASRILWEQTSDVLSLDMTYYIDSAGTRVGRTRIKITAEIKEA